MKNHWFVLCADHPDPEYRLFCFPYGGAGSGVFRKWGKAVTAPMQVQAVVPPGRERRFTEPRFEAVGPLIASLVPEIAPWLDRPFGFFGHSVGALMAFELTRELRRQGLPRPAHLFMSGRIAPQSSRPPENFRTLSGDALVAAVHGISHPADGPLPDPGMIKAMEGLLRSDFSITETYRYADEPPFDIPITAFGATQDATVTVEELLDWKAQTTAEFRHQIFEGGHFFIENRFEAIVRRIEAEIFGA